MSKESKQSGFWPFVIIILVVLVVILVWRGAVYTPGPTVEQPTKSGDSDEASVQSQKDGRSLAEVIGGARGWGPEERLSLWLGEKVPDFTVTDIAGKSHTLSNYRGRNVMVVFWATWCGPCIMEVPHLKELRESVSEDELAILAISNESPRLVKNFAAKWEINYTVFAANVRAIPRPFSMIDSIPSSFFIDKEGKIKLITTGVIPLRDIRAILQTEW